VRLLQRRKCIHCSIGGVGRCVRGETKKEGHSTFLSLADLCLCESVYQILLSSSSSGIGGAAWRFPNVRTFNEGLLRPRVARAQKIIRHHPFLCSALSLPAALAYPLKGGLVDPLMRASNEHILIVRVPRAGGRPGYPSPLIAESPTAAISHLGLA